EENPDIFAGDRGDALFLAREDELVVLDRKKRRPIGDVDGAFNHQSFAQRMRPRGSTVTFRPCRVFPLLRRIKGGLSVSFAFPEKVCGRRITPPFTSIFCTRNRLSRPDSSAIRTISFIDRDITNFQPSGWDRSMMGRRSTILRAA